MSDTKKDAQPVKLSGLEAMRAPFPETMIGKLPKPTKQQNECAASDKINCKVCGGWHHPRVVHLDYVGHAAITQRLLDSDPNWYWEPLAFDELGLPRFDGAGGLWIRLTVAGMTRIGYGDAQGKHGPSATKEAIGDAIRNAAMRFGAALELWHKGDWEADTLPPQPDDTQDASNATGGNVKDEPKLPECPQEWLDDKLPKLRQKVAAGKTTADAAADWILKQYTLTSEQAASLRTLGS